MHWIPSLGGPRLLLRAIGSNSLTQFLLCLFALAMQTIFVRVTHYVITVLDSNLVHITRMLRMICGSLGFAS